MGELDYVKGSINFTTYDMKKLAGGPEVLQQGAATTMQMTDAVIANL